MYKPARLVACVMLVLALFNWPYGYFQLLRLVVCGIAAYGTFLAYEQNDTGWAITLGLLALLFNPVAPVHLDRGTWAVIDLAAAGVLWFSGDVIEEEIPEPTSTA